MKLTSLTISRLHSWSAPGNDNPLRAVVKLASEKSTVECVLSEESMLKVLDLCALEIASEAEKRVAEFSAAVTALDGGGSKAMIGGNA